ncbi:MAG: hypothetical protein A3K75_02335 [Euryarchaeota archaeon RBG_13_61_15]|nr:MAG: hypothetical protein A3K75_02335 [Euryarchaeota archaeon RBG_13_61_15]
MTVVTMQQVEKALKKTVGRKGMSDDEIKNLAEYLMSFFGYTDEVIDNRLTSEDRDVFYMLEEEGLLTTTQEEVLLKKGKLWRIHYWILKKDQLWRIHYWILKKDQIIRLAKMDEVGATLKDEAAGVYDQVSDEEWSRHRTSADGPPGSPPPQG